VSAIPKPLAAQLRAMAADDLDAVVRIEQASYEFPWSAGIFADCLFADYSCQVLQLGSDIGGYGILMLGYRDAHVLNLCVRADLRRRGHGRLLLDHLLAVAVRREVETVLLEVRPSNPDAIRLYETAGFARIGIRRAYYPAANGREDALVLTKRL
jgi:ribosomal-protein-alanine N-acetyltransferase